MRRTSFLYAPQLNREQRELETGDKDLYCATKPLLANVGWQSGAPDCVETPGIRIHKKTAQIVHHGRGGGGGGSPVLSLGV